MTARIHRFKVGQTVNLILSIFRVAAPGHFEIVSLRPAEGENATVSDQKLERGRDEVGLPNNAFA